MMSPINLLFPSMPFITRFSDDSIKEGEVEYPTVHLVLTHTYDRCPVVYVLIVKPSKAQLHHSELSEL